MSSTLDRLRRLNHLRPARALLHDAEAAKPTPPSGSPRLGGRVVITEMGPCFVSTQAYPLESVRGDVALGALLERTPAPLGRVYPDFSLDAIAGFQDAAFLDTETTGLGTGASVYAFMVGLGTFERLADQTPDGADILPASDAGSAHAFRRAPDLHAQPGRRTGPDPGVRGTAHGQTPARHVQRPLLRCPPAARTPALQSPVSRRLSAGCAPAGPRRPPSRPAAARQAAVASALAELPARPPRRGDPAPRTVRKRCARLSHSATLRRLRAHRRLARHGARLLSQPRGHRLHGEPGHPPHARLRPGAQPHAQAGRAGPRLAVAGYDV